MLCLWRGVDIWLFFFVLLLLNFIWWCRSYSVQLFLHLIWRRQSALNGTREWIMILFLIEFYIDFLEDYLWDYPWNKLPNIVRYYFVCRITTCQYAKHISQYSIFFVRLTEPSYKCLTSPDWLSRCFVKFMLIILIMQSSILIFNYSEFYITDEEDHMCIYS